MELITKLEKKVHSWVGNAPHMPRTAQRWLGVNIWWIILVITIILAIDFLVTLNGLFGLIGSIGSTSESYYVTDNFTSVAILNTIMSLVYIGITGIILAFSIKPLQNKQKKGWVLLFLTLFVEAIALLVAATLSFSFAGFFVTVLFGAIGLAIVAYFIFEIHGEFAHPVRVAAKKTEE